MRPALASSTHRRVSSDALPGLSSDLLELFSRDGTLLVPTRQRAVAVRLAYAAHALSQGRKAWRTPLVLTPDAWLQQESLLAPHSRPNTPRLLRPAEEWLLWLRAAEHLTAQTPLLSVETLGRSLRRAARLMRDHDIDPARLTRHEAANDEAAWLGRALTDVDRAAAALGTVSAHRHLNLAEARLPTRELRVAGELRTVGLDPLPRAWKKLLDAAGAQPAKMVDTGSFGTAVVVTADTENSELRLAAQWCRSRLESDARARLLVIIPDLNAKRGLVTRTFSDALCVDAPIGSDRQEAAFTFEGGEPLTDYPWIAQALNGLTLLLRPLTVNSLLDWLRSPFWGSPSAAERARLDVSIRERLHGDCGLAELLATLNSGALQKDGTAQKIHRALTGAQRQLGERHLVPRQLLPHQWAERFQAALATLGCTERDGASSLALQLRVRWTELLEEFAETAPVSGAMTAPAALALLTQLLRATRFAPVSGDAAVTITDSRAHPVVRYSGIWVCRCTADRWPEPLSPDPFIPLALQRAVGMASASAAGQLLRAQTELLAWRRCASQLRLSWARQHEDALLLPSAMLENLPREEVALANIDPLLAIRAASQPTMSFADDRGPAWNSNVKLPGGSRSLELQDSCEFRAFAELRLDAQSLQSAQPGTDRRERGKLMHRALYEFWTLTGGRAGLAALSNEQLAARIADCVQRAGASHTEPILPAQQGVTRNRRREEARACRQLLRLCQFELRRQDFSVLLSEQSLTVMIDAATLSLRLDRVDELADQDLALIDYKTGEPANANEWFAARPRPVQLLVYLTALTAMSEGDRAKLALTMRPIGVLASLHIGRKAPRFKGVGASALRLPGQLLSPGARNWQGPNAAANWQAQLTLWQQRVRTLASEFLAGAATPNPLNRHTCKHCTLTPLCRRVERVNFNDLADALADELADHLADNVV